MKTPATLKTEVKGSLGPSWDHLQKLLVETLLENDIEENNYRPLVRRATLYDGILHHTRALKMACQVETTNSRIAEVPGILMLSTCCQN